MAEELLTLFQSIGLSEVKAKETAKNATVSSTLSSLILEVKLIRCALRLVCIHYLLHHPLLPTKAKIKVGGELDKTVGSLLYHLATRFKGQPDRASVILDYVCARKIASELQLTGEHGLVLLCCATWIRVQTMKANNDGKRTSATQQKVKK